MAMVFHSKFRTVQITLQFSKAPIPDKAMPDHNVMYEDILQNKSLERNILERK